MSEKKYYIMIVVHEEVYDEGGGEEVYYVAPDLEFDTKEKAIFIADSIKRSAETTGE
jgi:hypothetical protein